MTLPYYLQHEQGSRARPIQNQPAMWTQTEPSDVKFPQSHCGECDRDVLIYTTLGADENLLYHCLDCGQQIEANTIQNWNPAQMTEEGYRLEGQDLSTHKGSCGNCSTP